MPIFKNIFGCSSKDSTEESNHTYDDIKMLIQRMQMEQQIMQKEFNQLRIEKNNLNRDLKRIDDKIDTKFDIISGKIDNLIMMLTYRKKE